MHLGISYFAVFLVLGREVNIVSSDVFYIGGLFPLSVEHDYFRLSDGIYPWKAAEVAVEDVNSAGLLSPYNVTVRLEVADSGGSVESAVSSYVNFVQRWGLKTKTAGTEVLFLRLST